MTAKALERFSGRNRACPLPGSPGHQGLHIYGGTLAVETNGAYKSAYYAGYHALYMLSFFPFQNTAIDTILVSNPPAAIHQPIVMPAFQLNIFKQSDSAGKYVGQPNLLESMVEQGLAVLMQSSSTLLSFHTETLR